MWATAVYQLMIPKGSWALSESPNQGVGVFLWKEMMREVNGRKGRRKGKGEEITEGKEDGLTSIKETTLATPLSSSRKYLLQPPKSFS
jgi:hypothetical protein